MAPPPFNCRRGPGLRSRKRGNRPIPRFDLQGDLIGVVAALWLTAGCGPRIDPGHAAVSLAEQHVVVDVVVDAGATVPRVELVLLAGGSRWDPPGQEGRSAVALLDPATPAAVTVGRDHAWIVAECDATTRCARSAVDLATGVPWSAPDLDGPARRYWVDHNLLTGSGTDLATTVLFDLLYEAHPYGHSPYGRHGTLPALTDAHVRAFFRDQVRRSTVRARVVAPDIAGAEPVVAALGAALGDLPAGLPPDPAMKAPPVPPGVLAIGTAAADQAHVAIGFAVPRLASQPTRAHPTPDELARWTALRACTDTALRDMGLIPVDDRQAPAGWSDAVAAPAHPAVAFRGSGPPDTVVAAVTGFAERLRALADAPGCDDVATALREATPTAVVLWPDGIEDPWPTLVSDAPWTALVRLPDTREELLR